MTHSEPRPTAVSRLNLSAAELETRLETALDAVLSSRRTVNDSARALSFLSGEQQQFVLRWIKIICATNAELGYRFVKLADHALGLMDLEDAEAWVIDALDVYDREGLYPGTSALAAIDTFAHSHRNRNRAARLAHERNVLERYLQGLSGRSMRVQPGDYPYTDTESVFLPEMLDQMTCNEDNRFLFKAMATQMWAMNRFGTFRRATPDSPSLKSRLNDFSHYANAKPLFYALENERLQACIARELPGLQREMSQRFKIDRRGGIWDLAVDALSRADTTVADTLVWLQHMLRERTSAPPTLPWQCQIDFDGAEKIGNERLEQDRTDLQRLIQELIEQMDRDDLDLESDPEAEIQLEFEQDGNGDTTDYELCLKGESLAIPIALRERIDSILQDLDSIPENWLSLDPEPTGEEDGNSAVDTDLPQTENQDPVFYYDEWDHQRSHYRKHWCTLYERQINPDSIGIVDQILARHHGLANDLKRAFELLRDERRILKRQPDGEDIDLDAVVDANTDHHLGREISNRLFCKTHRAERDIAVMFMVDLSGSTKGWIVDAERESLVLLCEALEVLGDRYGIYGFSGMTRKRCELFHIKRLDEPYNDQVKGRIAGMQPRDYTRMGVTIRHLSKLMESVEAKTRLLITLSDGKPDDYDGYRGDYGIEDTRQALIEARNMGIHPFCITIDKQGSDYLPHMYGAVNYTVVDDVRKLPKEVSAAYCRLTR